VNFGDSERDVAFPLIEYAEHLVPDDFIDQQLSLRSDGCNEIIPKRSVCLETSTNKVGLRRCAARSLGAIQRRFIDRLVVYLTLPSVPK
jgi:hypothetical protein